MERRKNLPVEQPPSQELEATCEIEESPALDFYIGKELAKIKNELALLRHESFGGTMENHLEWLEGFIAKRRDCLAFLHIHRGEIVSALLGMELPLDELPQEIYDYIEQYAEDSRQRPVLWCNSITTRPDHQGKGFASDCLARFVEYAESYYRITGAFLICRIREQNFASEFTFTRAGFQRTHILDEEDAHGNNYINFRFWVKAFPSIHSPSAEIFIPSEKLHALRTSDAPYFTHS